MKFTFLILFVSCNCFAITLQEAIQTAFDRNPITQANDIRLEAAKDRARGAKLDMLPSGSFSYSRGKNSYDSYTEGVHSSDRYISSGWNTEASINLFRGGVDLNHARAMQKSVEALQAQNNSTNALIPDTKGSLANDVFDIYTSLVFNKEVEQFLETYRKSLGILILAAKTDDQKNEIKTAIAEVDNDIFSVKRNCETLILTYVYLVKMPFPGKIDNFEMMESSLIIPGTASEATKIALSKSPDILRAHALLESSKYDKKAQIAVAFSPRIDLVFSRGRDRSLGYRSIGNTVAVRVSVPLGVSQIAYTSAVRKEVDAKERDLDKEYDRLNHSIQDSLYPQLMDYNDFRERYSKTLEITTHAVEEQLMKIQNHQSVDTRYVLSLMGSQENQFFTFMNNEQNIVKTKFSIQSKIGTLFENIRAQLQ